MRKYAFLFLLTFSVLNLFGQQDSVTLTLDECINIAMDRNIELKRAKNGQLIAEANRFQSIMNFFPAVNAGINYDYFFGTFFDTNAARQVSATTNSSSPNINGRLILFGGGENFNNRKLAIRNSEAALHDVEDTKLQVETAILTFYLTVILDKENVKISRDRVELLKAQLLREEKRVSVGVGNLESVYNFRSQLATEELNLITQENTLKSDFLTLSQSMQLDLQNSFFDVAPYSISDEELLSEDVLFSQVLEEALQANPSLKAAHARRKSATYTYRIAKSDRLPEVSLFGQIGSNYSSNGATNPTLPYLDPVTGQEGFNFEPNATYFEQMDYNKFEYLNFTLSIPLFNRFQTSNAIQIAKIGISNAELDADLALTNVTNLVQQAYIDLVGAQTTYASANKNLEALNQTYEFMKKRFDTGNTDFYTYLESLNNKNRAEIQLVNAKYSIIFRKKVLDLYRGI